MNREVFSTVFVDIENDQDFYPMQDVVMAAYEPLDLNPVEINGDFHTQKLGK